MFAETTPGNDTLTFKGTFRLPPATTFLDLDPTIDAFRFLVYGASRETRLDVHLPALEYDDATRRGWTANSQGDAWTFRDKGSMPVAGIGQLSLGLAEGSPEDTGTLVELRIKAKRGTYPLGEVDVPVNFGVTFGDQAFARDGVCAESAYAGSDCELNGARSRLICRR